MEPHREMSFKTQYRNGVSCTGASIASENEPLPAGMPSRYSQQVMAIQKSNGQYMTVVCNQLSLGHPGWLN